MFGAGGSGIGKREGTKGTDGMEGWEERCSFKFQVVSDSNSKFRISDFMFQIFFPAFLHFVIIVL